LAIAAALRFYDLAAESIWLDEAITASRVQKPYLEMLNDWDSRRQAPLYYVVEKTWCDVFGTGEAALRFPSAVFGVLGVLAVYGLGCELFSQRTALAGALLIAISPFAIRYSQEARPYALFFLLATASMTSVCRLARDPTRGNLVRHVAFAAGGVNTHPFGPILLGLHAAIGWILRGPHRTDRASRSAKALRIGLASTAAICVPTLVLLGQSYAGKLRGQNYAGWIPKPALIEPLDIVVGYFESRLMGGLACLLIVGVICVRLRGATRARSSVAVLIAVIVSFIFVPWIVSMIRAPILIPRYTIPALGAVVLLVAWALTELPRRAQVLAIVALLVLTGRALVPYYTATDKDPWRATGLWLTDRVRPGDVVITPEILRLPLAYYFKPELGVEVVSPSDTTDLGPIFRTASHAWLIQSDRTPESVLDRIRRDLGERFKPGATYVVNDNLRLNPRTPFRLKISITPFDQR